MTTEEKAKAYDKALEKAKRFHTPDSNNTNLKAVIENIFPELAESEDELIVKNLIDVINTDYVGYTTVGRIEKHRIFAWLEKQKEQKSIEDVAKEVVKDKESAIKFLKSAGIMDENGELAEMYRSERKPSVWSEGDEENATYIGAALEAYYRLRKEQNNESGQMELDKAKEWLYNRFKSIRLQPKQGWSEEDEQVISAMIRDFESEIAVWEHRERETGKSAQKQINTYKGFISFIKSFRPNHWKPSEEQMGALAYARFYPYNPILDSLYHELEKL